MNTLILPAINAALALVENLIPMISALAKTGQITEAEQSALKTRYLSLRNAGDAAFTGPEWEITPNAKN